MIRRSPIRPATWVYFETPPSSAARAASLMCAGVSKSGSPAPKLTTSTPSALSSAARAVTARVIDGFTGTRREARRIVVAVMVLLLRARSRRALLAGVLGQERPLDRRRHE